MSAAGRPGWLREEIRDTLHLAWPLVGAQMLSMSMVFIDSLFVARLGPGPLAAMSMSVGFLSIGEIVCIGLLSPLSVFVSQEVGAGRTQAVGRTMRRGLALAFCLGVALALLALGAGPALRLLRQDAALIPTACAFLLALALGLPAKMGYVALRQLPEGASDTRPSVVVAAIAVLLNAVLDYGLVFGNLGLPQLGLVGSGLATAASQWLMFGLLFAYVRVNPRYAPYHLGEGDVDDGHSLAEIVRLGLPFSGALLAEVGFFAAATFLIGSISMRAQAAHQIALGAASFMFMMPLGLSFALTIRVSRARGARDSGGVRRAAKAGMAVTLLLQTVTAALFLLAPDAVVTLYTNDPALMPLAATLVRIGGVFQLFDGVQVASMGLLRGLLDTRVPFVITVLSYWLLGLPCSLLCAFGLDLGAPGVWYGIVLGLGAAASLLQWRLWALLADRAGYAEPSSTAT